MDDIENSAHGVPFNPSVQNLSETARNMGFTDRCERCKNPRLVHSKLKLKREEPQGAQNIMKKLSYMCRASLAEYAGTGDRDEKLANVFYVKIFHTHQK